MRAALLGGQELVQCPGVARSGMAAGPERVGRAIRRPWAAGQPRPTGGSPPGAALPPVRCPASAGRAVTSATRPRRPRRTLAGVVLLAPEMVLPRKITVKGAQGRVAPDGASATLDCDLPRKDLGAYQDDERNSTHPTGIGAWRSV